MKNFKNYLLSASRIAESTRDPFAERFDVKHSDLFNILDAWKSMSYKFPKYDDLLNRLWFNLLLNLNDPGADHIGYRPELAEKIRSGEDVFGTDEQLSDPLYKAIKDDFKVIVDKYDTQSKFIKDGTKELKPDNGYESGKDFAEKLMAMEAEILDLLGDLETKIKSVVK
jgi:hypothetical protein